MISRTYDIMIIGQWYQITFFKCSCVISEQSSMISYMMETCLYPQPKTRYIECCRSRALQVQVQDVHNRWRWSSALLDKALPVLRVQRIQTGDVQHCVSQSVIVLGRWAPHHPSSSSSDRVGTGGRPRRLRQVVLLEVEHAACKNSRVRWAFQLDLEWHYNIDNSWNPAVNT